MSNNRILGAINRRRVLDFLKSNPNRSYGVLEVSSLVGVTSTSVRMHLYALEQQNQIVCTQNNSRQNGKKKLFKVANWEK